MAHNAEVEGSSPSLTTKIKHLLFRSGLHNGQCVSFACQRCTNLLRRLDQRTNLRRRVVRVHVIGSMAQ